LQKDVDHNMKIKETLTGISLTALASIVLVVIMSVIIWGVTK
jgi:hypothetical protein